MKKTSDIGNKSQAERLKDILKSFGINSQEELDGALAGALEAMTIGIMTDTITVPANKKRNAEVWPLGRYAFDRTRESTAFIYCKGKV